MAFGSGGSRLFPRPSAGATAGKRVYLSQASLFNEVRVTESTPVIELSPVSLGLSDLRDVITTTGSGSVTDADGEITLSTGTTASSTARLESAEVIRYQPRYPVQIGQGIRRPSAPTGNEFWEIGLADTNDDNALYLGEDSTGLYLRHIQGGTEQSKVRQKDWNTDTLDGRGGPQNPSGVNLDLSFVCMPQWTVNWYGGGPAQLEIVLVDRNDANRSVTVPVHNVAASQNAPILNTPNLFITEKVDNGGDTTDFKLFVYGRQGSVQGKYDPVYRITPETVFEASLSGTTLVPVISFRRKTGFLSTSVKLNPASIITDSNIEWVFIQNPTLTGASFGSLSETPDDETAVEVDTAATSLSGGIPLDAGNIASSQGGATESTNVNVLQFDFIRDRPVTLAMRKVSGNGGLVTATFPVREEV